MLMICLIKGISTCGKGKAHMMRCGIARTISHRYRPTHPVGRYLLKGAPLDCGRAAKRSAGLDGVQCPAKQPMALGDATGACNGPLAKWGGSTTPILHDTQSG